MIVDEHFSSINILSALVQGCGKISYANCARLAAMMIEQANAALAESLNIDLKVSFINDDLVISLESLEVDNFAKLLSACLNTSSVCDELLFKRLEDELKFEQVDFDLQALKGYQQALLGIKNDKFLPTQTQLDEYFALLKNSGLKLCLSLAKSKLKLSPEANGIMQIAPAQKAACDISHLKSLQNPKEQKLSLKINKESFDLATKASANQSYMYFGAYLGEFDLSMRACADIVSMAFGAGFSSRLTELIRVQNGLAYSAFAKISYIQDQAFWLGLMQTKLSNETKAKNMIKQLFSELKDGLSEEEFNEAKAYLLSSFVLMQKDYLSKHKLMLNSLSSNKSMDFHERLKAQIQQTTLKQVNEFLKAVARETCFYVVSANAHS